MKKVIHSSIFKKDVKRCRKRACDLDRLIVVIKLLQNDTPLPSRCRPHRLSGNYSGFLECHIAPDWLLIYEVTDTEIALRRTGTHSDLF